MFDGKIQVIILSSYNPPLSPFFKRGLKGDLFCTKILFLITYIIKREGI